MALKTSEVYRCLEKKTLVFGFEVFDLFIVFLVLAGLNFLFQGVPYKFFLTWVPAAMLGTLLRWSKSGKPENYLLHLARGYFAPALWTAFPLASKRTRFTNYGKGQK